LGKRCERDYLLDSVAEQMMVVDFAGGTLLSGKIL